jgi:preprotein translocase subunit SecE
MASQAERLKNQEIAGGASESRANTLAERIKGFLRTLLERVTTYPQRLREYLHEVRVEMRQVTWPSREQVMATTFVVIVAVGFFGLFFFGVDSTVGYVLERVFNYFRR